MSDPVTAPVPVQAATLPATSLVVPAKAHQSFVASLEADLENAWTNDKVAVIGILSFIVGLIVAWVL